MKEHHSESSKPWYLLYYPIFLIAAYIFGVSVLTAGIQNWHEWMIHFMAGFFLVFSAFKFLNVRGFADAYATYDLLAARWYPYGFIYPFLELGLGIAYLVRFALPVTYLLTVLIMGFSSLGVMNALRQKRSLECACLGTVLSLPMSTITLIEDLLMVAMAIIMFLG